MLGREADLESPDGYIVKVTIYLIEHLLAFVRVCFQVFPSRMVKDSRESKGQAILLQLIKRKPNARVSSLKESMEPAPRPSNHLIATGPRLDGNTLHIKASFLEWITIL